MSNDDYQKTLTEDEAFAQQLKAEGVSAEEAGYRSTERIYGNGKADKLDLILLRTVCEQGLEADPDEGYLIGTLRWLDEHSNGGNTTH